MIKFNLDWQILDNLQMAVVLNNKERKQKYVSLALRLAVYRNSNYRIREVVFYEHKLGGRYVLEVRTSVRRRTLEYTSQEDAENVCRRIVSKFGLSTIPALHENNMWIVYRYTLYG